MNLILEKTNTEAMRKLAGSQFAGLTSSNHSAGGPIRKEPTRSSNFKTSKTTLKPEFSHNVALDPKKTDRVVSEENPSKSSVDKEKIHKQLSLLSKGMSENKVQVQSAGVESSEQPADSLAKSPTRLGEPLRPPYKIPDEQFKQI